MNSPGVTLGDPDAVASAVAGCPSVAGLSGGAIGEVASYLPGRRVPGVRLLEDRIEVHVVARYGPTMAEVADEVRAAVRGVAGNRPVAVVIEDLDVPGSEPPGSSESAALPAPPTPAALPPA